MLVSLAEHNSFDRKGFRTGEVPAETASKLSRTSGGKKYGQKLKWSLGSPVSPLAWPSVFPRSCAAGGSTLTLQPPTEKGIKFIVMGYKF